jgi:ABC-type branched-subunit amino acid transport system substrate-binding protein
VRVNFAGELAAIARVFVTVGRRRFAVLHASDSSGKAFLNQFSAALNTHGLPIVAAVPYERDTKDFTPMAKAVGASGADVVVVGGVTGPGIAFIRAMRGSSIGTQIACLSTVDDRAVWAELGRSGARCRILKRCSKPSEHVATYRSRLPSRDGDEEVW